MRPALLLVALALGCAPPTGEAPDGARPDAAWPDAGPDAGSPDVPCPAIAAAADEACRPPPLAPPPAPPWPCPAGWRSVAPGGGCAPVEPPAAPELGCAGPWPPPGGPGLHVDGEAPAEGADGSAARPFATLAAALAAAEAQPAVDAVWVSRGDFPGDLTWTVDAALIGRCPRQVRLGGTLILEGAPRTVAGLRISPARGPALVVPEEAGRTADVVLARLVLRGALRVRRTVGADDLEVEVAAGPAVLLEDRGQLTCRRCALASRAGPALVLAGGPSRAQVTTGRLTGGRPASAEEAAVPAVESAGFLTLTDVLVEAAGPTAVASAGHLQATRLALRSAVGAPDAAVLAVAPGAPGQALTLADVHVAVPAGGLGLAVCCQQSLRVEGLTLQGDGDADSAGLALDATGLEGARLSLTGLGSGGELVDSSGVLRDVRLHDLAGDGLRLRPGGEGTAADLEAVRAEGVAGVALHVAGDVGVDVDGLVAGVEAPVGAAVRAEDQARVAVTDAWLGPEVDEGLATRDARLTVDTARLLGPRRGLVSAEGGTLEGAQLVVAGAEAALVADDARLHLRDALVHGNATGLVRRLAADVALRDVRFSENAERDRCELVCTDRPRQTGAPPPLPR